MSKLVCMVWLILFSCSVQKKIPVIKGKDCSELKSIFSENLCSEWKTDSLGTMGLRQKYLQHLFDSSFVGVNKVCVTDLLGVPNRETGNSYVYNVISNRPGSNAEASVVFNKNQIVQMVLVDIE